MTGRSQGVWILGVLLAMGLGFPSNSMCRNDPEPAETLPGCLCGGETGYPASPPDPAPDPPQGGAQNVDTADQTRVAVMPAPGTDPSRYVPGSTIQSYNPFGAFRLGKVLIRPSGTIGYEYESNLLASATAEYADHSIRLGPAVEVFIPVSANGIRLEYSSQWRDYRRYDLHNKFDHEINADSRIDLSPILSLSLRDHFVVSSLDSREYAPGREVIFSDARFARNEVEGQLSWSATDTDTVALRAGWNRVTFDNSATPGSLPFYDYSECRYSAIYRRSISQRSSFFVDGTYRRIPTQDPRDVATSNGYETVAGIESAITPLITGQFSVGVRSDRYPGASIESNRTVVYRGSVVKEITERDQISFSLSRGSGMSYFQRNAYFLTEGYGITYSREMGRSLYLSLTPGYLRNSYPLPVEAGPGIPVELVGARRVDELVEFRLDARYTFSEWLAIEVWFDYLRRKSLFPDYSFRDYRFGVDLLIGSRMTTLGRPPY